MEKKKLKESRGITLVALVVTIIVLLILAGVAITTLSGRDNMIAKAKEARDNYNEAGINEEDMLSSYSTELEKHGKETREEEEEDDDDESTFSGVYVYHQASGTEDYYLTITFSSDGNLIFEQRWLNNGVEYDSEIREGIWNNNDGNYYWYFTDSSTQYAMIIGENTVETNGIVLVKQ